MVLVSLKIECQFTLQNVSAKFTFCTSSFNQNFLVLGPASAGLFAQPKKISYKLLK